jgi:hypothetical protein
MPLNTYNNKAPFKARVKSVERIVGPKATGETCNIVIETEGKIPFWEGQSYGVIPPVSPRSYRVYKIEFLYRDCGLILHSVSAATAGQKQQ